MKYSWYHIENTGSVQALLRFNSATEWCLVILPWLTECVCVCVCECIGQRNERAKTATIHKIYSVVYILFICSIYCFMLSAIAHLGYTQHNTLKYVWTLHTEHTQERLCTLHTAAQSIQLHAYNQIWNTQREWERDWSWTTQHLQCGKLAFCWFSNYFEQANIFYYQKNSWNICVHFPLNLRSIYPVII